MTAKSFDVTTVGEVMLRLSVPAGDRMEVASSFAVAPGGAESNVVTALARLGRQCGWVGGLPQTALGRLALNQIRAAGVDVQGIVWSPTGRMGTYYVEFATLPRPIQVIYDRADSCAAQLQPDQIDWQQLLNSRLIHLTGITVALSPSCRAIVQEAVERAQTSGVAVSFDINYRQKLWSSEEARNSLLPLIKQVDLLFCKQGDAALVFGCDGTAEQMVQQLGQHTNARHIVMTMGEQGVLGWDRTQFWHEPAMLVDIVDRLGAGDALAAGVIHGWLDDDLARGLRYGTALAALALAQHGDMVVTTFEEVELLLGTKQASIVR